MVMIFISHFCVRTRKIKVFIIQFVKKKKNEDLIYPIVLAEHQTQVRLPTCLDSQLTFVFSNHTTNCNL